MVESAGLRQTDLQRALGRQLLHAVAANRRTHPAHGFVILKMLNGVVTGLLHRYDDDPALAACQILDCIDIVLGYCSELKRWATAVNACDPADMNTYGARLKG
jgi:hypothetical protein